ncbi:Dyp-type peroxidase domain-containing protein, partial [Staphylococcus aureus]|uniref:Dyp-type peroxidase domain-containing protein n=1 Tax=Staphylococcus aureus TaxID=1280 RepID=UPI0037DA64EA
MTNCFINKIPLSTKIPDAFKHLPHFPNHHLIHHYTHPHIIIQPSSNHSQLSFHPLHNLLPPFPHILNLPSPQSPFISPKPNQTPTNLMSFKDPTINPRK